MLIASYSRPQPAFPVPLQKKALLHESAIASQSILQFGIQTMRYSDEKSTPLPVRMRYATDP